MKFTQSLKKNSGFQLVYKEGKSKANKLFIMYVHENNQAFNQLGISVSKKVGNSVVRHHIKRLVLESYRLQEQMFNSGLNIVVIARPMAKDAGYREVAAAIMHLAALHKILKSDEAMNM